MFVDLLDCSGCGDLSVSVGSTASHPFAGNVLCGQPQGFGQVLFSCGSILRGRYVSLERECSVPALCMQLGYLHLHKAGIETTHSPPSKSLSVLLDDPEGARHLPAISMSSYVQAPALHPLLCVDGLAISTDSEHHCLSSTEPFPWLLLQYPEEVRQAGK